MQKGDVVVVQRGDAKRASYARVMWARKGGLIRTGPHQQWSPACLAGCVLVALGAVAIRALVSLLSFFL